MARPVEYNINEVLDKAMEIFWEKGYESVSMAQLVDYTGLNRGTMYSLFKDKNGLYKDALENYYLKMASKQLAVLKKYTGKKGIKKFFEAFSFDNNFAGCLYTNTIIEKQFVSVESFETVKTFYIEIREQIEKNLLQATEDGEFSGSANAMSLTLMTIVQGLGVFGKYNQSKEDSDSIIKNVLSLIR